MKILLVYGNQTVDLDDIRLNPVTEASLSYLDANNDTVFMRSFPTVADAVAASTLLMHLIEQARIGGITIEIIIDDL